MGKGWDGCGMLYRGRLMVRKGERFRVGKEQGLMVGKEKGLRVGIKG